MSKINVLPNDCWENIISYLGLERSLNSLFFASKNYRSIVQNSSNYIKNFHPNRTKITDELGHSLRIATVNEPNLKNFEKKLQDLLKFCHQHNENFIDVLNSADHNPVKGYTALHLAFFKKKLSFMDCLLKYQGCRYDIPDQYGISVISNLCSQLKKGIISIDSYVINIIVNAICRKYGYTIKGYFDGIIGIHCAISQTEQKKEILEKYLLECYRDHKEIPYTYTDHNQWMHYIYNTTEPHPLSRAEEREIAEAYYHDGP